MTCFKCKELIEESSKYGLHLKCYREWFQVEDAHSFTGIDPKKMDSYNGSNIEKIKDSFYHGKYKKYSARINNVKYILKVQESQSPDLPEIEFISNEIASLLDMNIPDHYLIAFGDKNEPLPTFVARNFMQDHVGTLDHIYKFLPKGEKNYNCKNIVQTIRDQTKSEQDVHSFVRICLFDSFIGNGDRHGRNLGIITTRKGSFLAPMYDNPTYFGIENPALFDSHFTISGCIQTSFSKESKIQDYISEFKKLSFEDVCQKFLKKIKKRFPQIIEKITNSTILEKRKEFFIQYLENQKMEISKNV